jgi:lipopolysaccharide export system protein LptA
MIKELIYLLISFSCLGLLSANEGMVKVDSTYADYDGKRLLLKGDVTIEHELGKIDAAEMLLNHDLEGKNHPFRFLTMTGSIMIQMHDRGVLTCAKAEFDHLNQTGKLSGEAAQLDPAHEVDPAHQDVIYRETCLDKKGKSTPLTIKSPEMQIKTEKNAGQPTCFIKEIIAENYLELTYDQDFKATSNYGIYERSSSQNEGTITLKAKDSVECQVVSQKGDTIKAEQISIDIGARKILFTHPKGAFSMLQACQANDKVHFSCDSLFLEPNQKQLILENHVIVDQRGFGQLENDDQVIIQQSEKELSWMEATGETHLVLFDKATIDAHHLTCYGKLIIDHTHLKAFLDSPKDDQGKVIKEKQVFFHDLFGEIYADQVHLKYQLKQGSVIPFEIILEGNVRVLNRISLQTDEEGSFLQYATADRIEYFPSKKEMFLRANPGHRVLFYDKMNKLQVSAIAIQIQRDMQTNKDSIQGKGDVRFNFIEKERTELQNQFGLTAEEI